MGISKTAYWAAAARAQEHGRPDRIFEDPFAQRMAGEEGPKLLEF